MKIVFLIMIGISVLYAEFVKSGEIVKDTISKLEWQDNAIGSSMKWEAAISYCEELTLGRYDDWRLPNINELKSIADRSKVQPAIVNVFTHTDSKHYWSSTTYKGYRGSFWSVHFGSGVISNIDYNYSCYVRCVRAGQ